MERSATRAPERSYRLLVVDDDEVDRRNYSRLLTGQAPGACDIRHAADGATGLAALHAERFDCVLLDLNLPDMTGLEFLAAASDDGKLPCAIILITGYGNETVAVEAMKCGIQDYLVKDRVNASNLWRAMTTAVTQTDLRQRLASSMHGLTAANAALENEVIVRKAVEVELRAAKEAAEQANQAKTRFVATVTHELRTPLNGILGYAQLLCIEGGLSAGQEARVGAMMQAGRHLLEMIQGVLDFASIETGQLVLRPVPVAVRELAERCIAFVRPMAGKHALGLRMVVGPDAPRQISTDPTRLRQVLLNLLGNAVKYTTAGSVELRLLDGATQGGLRIEIADTGPGIDAANRDRLFQDFERLSAVTSVEGAGLGLAIAARIVGVMNGSIGHVDNPGGGSVFWLDLPTAGTVPLLSDAVPAAQSPAALRVLAVDDVAINRDVVHGFLRAAGHEVWLAGSGQDAIRLAGERTFDLILMDVRMPGMDGLEATRRIRSLPGPRGQVPILALSAYSMLSQIEDFRNAGMNGHVEKPVDQATLMSAIGDAVASERQDRLEGRHSWNSIEIAPEKRHPPRFDRELFDTVLGFRQSDEVAARLKSLHSRMEEMSRLLEAPTLPGVLGEAAHRLASTAGTFGFVALSVVARSFERATVRGSPDLVQLTQQVSMEARAALAILDEVMCERRMLPA